MKRQCALYELGIDKDDVATVHHNSASRLVIVTTTLTFNE
jgi:hypothetical protein